MLLLEFQENGSFFSSFFFLKSSFLCSSAIITTISQNAINFLPSTRLRNAPRRKRQQKCCSERELGRSGVRCGFIRQPTQKPFHGCQVRTGRVNNVAGFALQFGMLCKKRHPLSNLHTVYKIEVISLAEKPNILLQLLQLQAKSTSSKISQRDI